MFEYSNIRIFQHVCSVMSDTRVPPDIACAQELHGILLLVNSRTFPHHHRLVANASIAVDYLSHVQTSSRAFVSKPLVAEICKLWSRMESVCLHSEYQVLEPELSNLTLALRRAHVHFCAKWSDVNEVFEDFCLHSPETEDIHTEYARYRLMSLEYTKLIDFLTQQNLGHLLRQFHAQLGKERDDEMHP